MGKEEARKEGSEGIKWGGGSGKGRGGV